MASLKQLVEYGFWNLVDRLNKLRKEMVTRLNMLGALLALYALANPTINEKVLGFIPEGGLRETASILLPIAWFWLVQKGKEIDKAKTLRDARLDQITDRSGA